jgi:hypothetical protein
MKNRQTFIPQRFGCPPDPFLDSEKGDKERGDNERGPGNIVSDIPLLPPLFPSPLDFPVPTGTFAEAYSRPCNRKELDFFVFSMPYTSLEEV